MANNDPISDFIKNNPTYPSDIRDVSSNISRGIARHNTHQNNHHYHPVLPGSSNPVSHSDLSVIISSLGRGHHQIQRIHKYGTDAIYRTGVDLVDKIRNVFGYKQYLPSPATLFEEQLATINRLNDLLDVFIPYVKKNIDQSTRTAINILEKEAKSIKEYNSSASGISKKAVEYEELLDQFNTIDRFKDPDSYLSIRSKIMHTARDINNTRGTVGSSNSLQNIYHTAFEHAARDIDVADSMLNTLSCMHQRSQAYSTTLEQTMELWNTMYQIAAANHVLSKGITTVAQSQHFMADQYKRHLDIVPLAVRSVAQSDAIRSSIELLHKPYTEILQSERELLGR